MLAGMRIIKLAEAPVFHAGGTTVTAYAAPSRGAAETSVWQVELAPGSASPPHTLDHEEVFLATSGRVVAVVGGDEHVVAAGECLIVPAGTRFSLHARGAEPFRALVCLPCGARATVLPDGAPFVPPWAQ
jgi:quercetin dioxygenase-like cupin family protein